MLGLLLKGKLTGTILRVTRIVFMAHAAIFLVGTIGLWWWIGGHLPCLQENDCVGERQLAQGFVALVGGLLVLDCMLGLWFIRDEGL